MRCSLKLKIVSYLIIAVLFFGRKSLHSLSSCLNRGVSAIALDVQNAQVLSLHSALCVAGAFRHLGCAGAWFAGLPGLTAAKT